MRRLAAVAAALLALAWAARPAAAQPQLHVSPATDLDPAGQTVQVDGAGYDSERGIYVAWCVVPPTGQKPTPCGGGDDRSGMGGSEWISSNPAYGATLAKPYGPGGSFSVQVRVSRFIGDTDCLAVACAVTTRNDHENPDDRSQDAYARVAFRSQPASTTMVTTGPAATQTKPTVAPRTTSTAATTTSATTPTTVPGADASAASVTTTTFATQVIRELDTGGRGSTGLAVAGALGGAAAAAGLGAALRARRRRAA